ncbi:MAG: nitrilase-related carbon-nitrogen hydrolase [Marinilabiliaceae bacterium]
MTISGPSQTVGLLQYAPVMGDIDANIDKIDRLLNKSQRSADIWVLPELASSGYNFASKEEAMQLSEPLHNSRFIEYLTHKAAELETLFVSGMNERDKNLLYNSALLVGEKGVMGHYRKLHLFNREKEYFTPGDKGLPVFDTPIGKVGMLVCFDWMFPEVWRILALQQVHLIAHPSNLVLPYCQTAMPGYALTNRIFIATTNRTGQERDLTFTGQSVLVNPSGEYLLRGGETEEKALTCSVDLSQAENKKMTPYNHAFGDRRSDIYHLSENKKHQK